MGVGFILQLRRKIVMKKNNKKVAAKKASSSKNKLKAADVKSQKVKQIKSEKQKPTSSFPIVGIGASAGGLEALGLFLKNVPKESNMAYVIVQHLDPTHKGMMVELLQRSTSMKVIQVKDRTRIQSKCIYVIPPNKDMSILHGVLHLFDMVEPRGLRLPIDFFFRSLADDQQDKSIGVVLSGMGSDGTLGLRAIKEKAGIVFVQDPNSAKFSSMPQSAIDSGLADVVAKVEEIPAKIINFILHTPRIIRLAPSESKTLSALEKILILMRTKTGHDFSQYKKTTVYRRIERRMSIHQIDKITNYVRFLQQNPTELEFLFKELLIGVTSFFRDPLIWENLKNKVIGELIKERKQNNILRAWVPGCSTGEEAYSLAIVFKEALRKLKPKSNINLQIFATDLDEDAIDNAREGFFPLNIAADVLPERLNNFFIRKDNGYEVSKQIREMIIFAKQNIIMNPPFTKLDILSCRNLLIYFTPELQKKVIPLFHYALNLGGVLVLGTAETIGNFSYLFKPSGDKSRIYRRLDSPAIAEPFIFPSGFTSTRILELYDKEPFKPNVNIQAMSEQIVLQQFSPAAVVVNDTGDIFFISGRTGKYLEPAAGKANWNIFAMARQGLRYELTSAFQKALKKNNTVNIKNISIGNNGGKQLINLTVQPIMEPKSLQGMVIIVFKDVESIPESKNLAKGHRSKIDRSDTRELERELEKARQDLKTINEEMQTSQEELKSTNEELQSTNEELQSTNEELTTSKEEMQSLNEELQTINHEMQFKLDDLTRVNNDMKNLLDSTDLATLFLDNSFNLRRFTNRASEITNLIPGDVGRPITDIASELFYSGIENDVKDVLKTLISSEKEILSTDGHWYLARILPYRTLDNMIDGVVITYTNITSLKYLQAQLRKAHTELETKYAKQTEELDQAKDDLRIEILHQENDDQLKS